MVVEPAWNKDQPPPRWWQTRWFVALLALLAAVPLVYPPIPPLVDLFGHIGRYRVQLDLDTSLWLQQYYSFEWAPIGNLGVDLLVLPLSPVLGLEAAVKLVVLIIPAMTVAGFLWVSREVHGRIPPTTFFALPFAIGFPFLFGFVNFALSMALAFLAFALWLRLGRLERTRLRAILFVPISIVIFFTHTYGWGALGLLCFSGEAVRLHDRGRPWLRAGIEAALHALVMALPLLIMLAWRTEAKGGFTAGWFEWGYKWEWIYSALRDRWEYYDLACLALVGAIALYALVSRKLIFSRNLAFSALILLAAFLLLPRVIFGSAYADMRLVPYMMAVFLLAIRYRGAMEGRTVTLLAATGLGFFLMRIASTTASLAIASDQQQAALEALDQLPIGARVVTLVGRPCHDVWALPRDTHLGGMVIVRRHGFSNDQWVIEGANLLGVRYRAAGPFTADPSQMVVPNNCRAAYRKVDQALRTVPRDAFDYVWMVDPPEFRSEAVAGMEAVWRGKGSILYRIEQ